MLPLTVLTVQKLADLLVRNGQLSQNIASMAQSCNITIPGIGSGQVCLTSVGPEIGDKDVQLSYPRVCLYSAGIRNTLQEKFRTLSGSVLVVADIWSSGNLVSDAERWIQYYVEALTGILRRNIGDWGDGVFFGGLYEVQLNAPKQGGFGYVVQARISCNLTVSGN